MPRHGRKWFVPSEDDDWEERARLYAALEAILHTEWQDGERDDYLELEDDQLDEEDGEGEEVPE